MSKKKLFINIIFIIWALFITAGYFFSIQQTACSKKCSIFQSYKIVPRGSHLYYFQGVSLTHQTLTNDGVKQIKINPIYLIVLSSILLIYFLSKYFLSRQAKEIKLSPLHLIIYFVGIFAIVYESWVFFFGLHGPIVTHTIFYNFTYDFLAIFLIGLVATSLGKKILDLFKVKFKNLLDILLVSFALGIISIYLVDFFLALFGQLKLLPIATFCAIALLFSYKEVIFWLRAIYTKNITIEKKQLVFLLIAFTYFLIFLSHNLLQLMRPLPMGHDDLESYLNTTNLLANQGKLISATRPYPWELINATGKILFGSISNAMWLTALTGVITTIALGRLTTYYMTANGYQKNRILIYSVAAAVIFYTLPSITYQSSIETKVDIPALSFGITGTLLIFQYLQNKDKKYFFLSALFVGMAFAIKITNIFLIASILIFIIYQLWLEKKPVKKIFSVCATYALITLALISPFLIFNTISTINTRQKLSFTTLFYGIDQKPKLILDESPQIKKLIEPIEQLVKKDNTYELSRFKGRFSNPTLNYILTPFTLTWNNADASGKIIDIGYLFLAFLPFLFIKRKSSPKLNITLFTVVYYLIWLFFSSGIIWYGFFLLVLVSIIFTGSFYRLAQSNDYKPLRYLTYLLIAVWLVINLLSRPFLGINPWQKNVITPAEIAYAKGLVNSNQYANLINPDESDIFSKIALKNNDKILLYGQIIKYFLPDNNLTTYQISLSNLANFTYLRSPQESHNLLSENHIRYIIVKKSSFVSSENVNATLAKERDRFYKFVLAYHNNRYFQLLNDSKPNQYIIIKVK